MAFISEIKYTGFGEASSNEFVEITLGPNDDPADFTISFYDADGTLHAAPSSFFAAGEFTIQDVIDITGNPGSSPSGVGGLDLEVTVHPDNPDFIIVVIPADLARGTTGISSEAVALTDTSTGTVVDAYDIGSGSNSVTFTEGAASGATPTPTVNGPSIQIDYLGNISTSTPNPGSASTICLASGTRVMTITGNMAVEDLTPGMLLKTYDGGYKPLRASFYLHADQDTMNGNVQLKPVKIPAYSLGSCLPRHDLYVSRQHRMILRSSIVERMFGVKEVLVAAHVLTDLPRIEFSKVNDNLDYYHLLLDRHEIIYAEGAPTETLLLATETKTLIPEDALAPIIEKYPLIKHADDAVRLIPRLKQQRTLIQRHLKNHQPVFTKREEAYLKTPA